MKKTGALLLVVALAALVMTGCGPAAPKEWTVPFLNALTGQIASIGEYLQWGAERAAQEINDALIAASKGKLKGVLAVTNHPNVSIDFNHDPHSSTFALDQTKVMDGTLVRILTWYDNEWGFSNRMGDTAVAMGKLI